VNQRDAIVYTATHARIDSWMMGILFGYLMHISEGREIKMPKAVVAIGWTLSSATLLAIVFAQYPLMQEHFKDNPVIADATFESLKRILWSLSIGWIIMACQFNYGNIIKRFLSLSIFLPISKISYCLYLIHLPIQLIFLSSIRSPQFFSNFRAIHKFFGDFGVAFVVAFMWALIFEVPTQNMITILLAKRKQLPHIKTTTNQA